MVDLSLTSIKPNVVRNTDESRALQVQPSSAATEKPTDPGQNTEIPPVQATDKAYVPRYSAEWQQKMERTRALLEAVGLEQETGDVIDKTEQKLTQIRTTLTSPETKTQDFGKYIGLAVAQLDLSLSTLSIRNGQTPSKIDEVKSKIAAVRDSMEESAKKLETNRQENLKNEVAKVEREITKAINQVSSIKRATDATLTDLGVDLVSVSGAVYSLHNAKNRVTESDYNLMVAEQTSAKILANVRAAVLAHKEMDFEEVKRLL